MYQWYKNSTQCLAYLADVPDRSEAICSSRWFTRGWTLQELIAPSNLIFFSAAWSPIIYAERLVAEIHKRTGIPATVLKGADGFRSAGWCVALDIRGQNALTQCPFLF
jgi:hypothetical protein